jgi:hypothetical protein
MPLEGCRAHLFCLPKKRTRFGSGEAHTLNMSNLAQTGGREAVILYSPEPIFKGAGAGSQLSLESGRLLLQSRPSDHTQSNRRFYPGEFLSRRSPRLCESWQNRNGNRLAGSQAGCQAKHMPLIPFMEAQFVSPAPYRF